MTGRMFMNIVVVGNGKVGTTLTRQLAKEGHDIVIVDNNPEVIENLVNMHDILGVCGNASSYDVLMQAGVDRADLFIAVTSADELNLLSCMLAKKIGAKHTIARVRNPEYGRFLSYMRKELGLSMAINPEYEAANEIYRILRLPEALEVDSFAKGRVDLIAVKLNEGNRLIGHPISQINRYYAARILICAVERDNKVFIPGGDFVLQDGDKLFITGHSEEMDLFFKESGTARRKIKNVMIIGGGKIAYYLAERLLKLNIEIKIIEKNNKRCLELSEMLPKAVIVHGDGTDQDVLMEEGIQGMDACVALTDNDEENIILSMYATTLSLEKVVTKVNRISFLKIIGNAGIDSIISPKVLTANHIVRYVRAMQTTETNSIRTLYQIVDGQAEAIEFPVTADSLFAGKAIKEIKIKMNNLIACIIRNGRIIYPDGNAVVEVGDNVVVVTTCPLLKDLNDIVEKQQVN